MLIRVLYIAAIPLLAVFLAAGPSECATDESPRLQALRHQNAGVALARLGQHDEAIAEYEAGLAIDPSVDSLYYSRGRAYFELQQFDAALADLNKAIELESERPSYYYQRGATYHALGSSDQARADLEHVLSITSDPDHTYPALNLLARIPAN